MLGVAADAGADDIHSAYRRRARELHPDTAEDRSPAAQAASQARMAEINEAFRTLGDPERRRTYDLRRRSRPATTATGGSAGAPAMAPDEHEPSRMSPAAPAALLAGVLPWLTLVLVLGAIFVFTAYAGGGDDDGNRGRGGGDGDTSATIAVRDIRGQCIQQSGGFTLVVNCASTPNEGRIVAQGSLGATCPEGTRGWDVPQEELLACTAVSDTP